MDADQTSRVTACGNYLGNSVEPTSSIGSRELGWFEDKGLRTKLTDQPYIHVDEDETDNESTDNVTVKRANVYTLPAETRTLTPDSVFSTGNRTLYTNGRICNIDVSNVQEHYDAGKTGVSKSMRTEIKELQMLENVEEDQPSEINRQNQHEQQVRGQFTKETKVRCLPKLFALILVTLVLVAGLVVLIYFKKGSDPGRERGIITPTESEDEDDVTSSKSFCSKVKVNLKGIIRFNCSLVSAGVSKDNVDHVYVAPPPYWNEGIPFNITVSEQELDNSWSAYFDIYNNYYILRVRGPKATCSSGGTYNIQLRNRRNETTADTKINIEVKSEVSRVNVSLTQDKDKKSPDFRLGCSTNSGCEQSFVDFFAEINQEEQHLRGVNFTCSISYNDYDGYSVSCVGVIPNYLLSQFEKITCRPKSSLLDDLDEHELEDLEVEIELPECDLTKHCGYTCKMDGDYFVVSRERCDIFHRCYQRQVFTSYCAPGTFFDPNASFCACRHTRDLSWCQDNGALKPGSKVSDDSCS